MLPLCNGCQNRRNNAVSASEGKNVKVRHGWELVLAVRWINNERLVLKKTLIFKILMNGENLEYNCFSDIMKAIKSPDSANLSSSMISEVIQIVF